MNQSPIKLLYIDDDPGLRRLIEKKLKRLRFIVSTAENGFDGIEKCENEQFDIIIVDQNMPDISGLGLIYKIPHIIEHTPIIMMTGGGDETLAVDALKSGASDYVIKDTAGRFLENIQATISNAIDKQNLINEKRQIEKTLQENLDLNKAILNSISASIAILDQKGHIVEVNKQWLDFGRENDISPYYDFIDVNYLDVCKQPKHQLYFDKAEEACKGIEDVINGVQDGFKLVYECSSPEEQRWFEMRVTKVADLAPTKVVVSHEDITSLKSSEIMLKKLSETDGLTGISNRRVFDEAIEREYSRAVRNKSSIAVLMMDIDFFKAYNDHYGHLQGDECIKSVANLLKNSISRPTDICARYG